MKKNRSSKNWIIKQHRDQYFKHAKSSGFRSRSAYKLLELNKKFWMTHNPQVKEQITAILDMYKAEMEGRRAKAKKINSQDGDNSLDNLINIS